MSNDYSSFNLYIKFSVEGFEDHYFSFYEGMGPRLEHLFLYQMLVQRFFRHPDAQHSCLYQDFLLSSCRHFGLGNPLLWGCSLCRLLNSLSVLCLPFAGGSLAHFPSCVGQKCL